MIQKHESSQQPDHPATAPYNFVPLSEDVISVRQPLPDHDVYNPDLLSGKLVCKLRNDSPLYIRAAQSLDEFCKGKEGKIPALPFYGAKENTLLLPGSSLRGMLRNMIEILTYSKIAPVTSARDYYRTVGPTSIGTEYQDDMLGKVRGGIFKQDKNRAWIEPAWVGRVHHKELVDVFNITVDENNRFQKFVHKPDRRSGDRLIKTVEPVREYQHQKVYVQLSDETKKDETKFYHVKSILKRKDEQKKENYKKGILLITGFMHGRRDGRGRKSKEFVFVPKENNEEFEIDDDTLKAFLGENQLTKYQQEVFGGGENIPKGYPSDGDPVFFLLDDEGKKVKFFGRAMMFRLGYRYTPYDMLPSPHKDPALIDMAEAMFGRVVENTDKTPVIAGRLSVSNAIYTGDDPQKAFFIDKNKPEHLKILSSPKPSNYPHYLVQDHPDDSKRLKHYNSTPIRDTTIRGHKLYWHRGIINAKYIFERDEEKLRSSKDQYSPEVVPLRPGQTFEFIIRFNNLRYEELGALLWVLDTAANPQYRLKLGMGKPYGMGSVAIELDVKKSQIIDRNQRYQTLFCSNGRWSEGEIDLQSILQEARKEFKHWLLGNGKIHRDGEERKIEDLERIKDFLTLLSWEGPPRGSTQYIEKVGDFRQNKVLPPPGKVLGGRGKKV